MRRPASPRPSKASDKMFKDFPSGSKEKKPEGCYTVGDAEFSKQDELPGGILLRFWRVEPRGSRGR